MLYVCGRVCVQIPAAMQRSVAMLFTADADAPFTPGSIGAIANQKIVGSSRTMIRAG